jgi:hypothetical protein
VIHRNQRLVQFGWHSQIANLDLWRNLGYSCQSLIVKRRRLILRESTSSASAIAEGTMLIGVHHRQILSSFGEGVHLQLPRLSFMMAALFPCSQADLAMIASCHGNGSGRCCRGQLPSQDEACKAFGKAPGPFVRADCHACSSAAPSTRLKPL